MLNIINKFNQLGINFYSNVKPNPIESAIFVHTNQNLANKLNLGEINSSQWLSFISGNKIITDYQPIATIYAGHQFGHWVAQLGDGRAMLIAEHQAINGKVYELQLKGSGTTPYSRMGDGKAVLRSSIREYLCSHAMNKLNIPTTQALAVIDSVTPVIRERQETAAVVLRVAQSFIRFGHFELFASRNQSKELQQLIEFCKVNYYPESLKTENSNLFFLEQVIKNTAYTVAHWQAVGFCHGVMNTDNMSILGLTLDYGPFGFLDSYDPKHICNHSDYEGRYSYNNQPQIAWWNLNVLASCFINILTENEINFALEQFAHHFNSHYMQLMGKKLGIINFETQDLLLLQKLLDILEQSKADWTIFWRTLSNLEINQAETLDNLLNCVLSPENLSNWLDEYFIRRQQQDINFETSKQLMLDNNPIIVLRNHLAQVAIEKAQGGDYSEVDRLFNALSTPFEFKQEFTEYYDYPPSWANTLSVSCSS